MNKNLKRRIKLYLFCLFFIFFQSSFSQTAEDILNRYFRASSNGDIANWGELKTLYATAVCYYSQRSFLTQKDTFERENLSYKKLFKQWPDEQRDEFYSDSLLKQRDGVFFSLKDRRVIIIGYMDPVENKPDERSTFDFYPLRISKYMSKSKSIKYNGLRQVPGKLTQSHEIEIKTSENTHVLLFDVESNLLDAIYVPQYNVYWIISDYKLFDGHLMPTYIASVKNGVTYSWTRYKSFVFNLKFDRNKFDPDH